MLNLYFAFIFFLSVVTAHDVCEFRRVSLGITKTASECQARCVGGFNASETLDCVAWGHNEKNEKCSGWVLDTDPDYYDDYFYDVGYYYSYSYTEFDTCSQALFTDIAVPADGDRPKKQDGCFFEEIDLGYALTATQCQNLCETFDSNKFGGCVGWSHSEEESECQGLVSAPSGQFSSCGRGY